MAPRLSEDQRQAIEQHGGAPVDVVDVRTNANYVLLSAEQFERMKTAADGEIVDAMYPLLADIAPEDWEDASLYAQEL
jgi:hypothetical protein